MPRLSPRGSNAGDRGVQAGDGLELLPAMATAIAWRGLTWRRQGGEKDRMESRDLGLGLGCYIRRKWGCPGRQIKSAADVEVFDALPYMKEEEEQGRWRCWAGLRA